MSTQWKDRISDDERSRPALRASGVSVEAILNALADGWSRERILATHPALSEEDLRACIAYAAEAIVTYAAFKKQIQAEIAQRSERDE
jgi:uncharacterized protein (DUF433 family)